eukprot:TRINITY_DN12338_c0_g1_i1.p1 TRINITY_DN12338_c0_g1~~TRINITY_DN12338_c0_g1_i1.p1  ORF type:complete len:134 (+),score=22.34 TRINITY_DN12338_c0_g1_i1:90-491(+)
MATSFGSRLVLQSVSRRGAQSLIRRSASSNPSSSNGLLRSSSTSSPASSFLQSLKPRSTLSSNLIARSVATNTITKLTTNASPSSIGVPPRNYQGDRLMKAAPMRPNGTGFSRSFLELLAELEEDDDGRRGRG